jgi:hypothetical protein
MSAAPHTTDHGAMAARRLTEHNEILKDCLAIAMRELTFCAMPNTRQALRAINDRLAAAAIKVIV